MTLNILYDISMTVALFLIDSAMIQITKRTWKIFIAESLIYSFRSWTSLGSKCDNTKCSEKLGATYQTVLVESGRRFENKFNGFLNYNVRLWVGWILESKIFQWGPTIKFVIFETFFWIPSKSRFHSGCSSDLNIFPTQTCSFWHF